MDLKTQILLEHSADNAKYISEYIESNPNKLKDLLQIILEGDVLLSQRSAWTLIKFSKDFYIKFIPHLDYILSKVKNAKHVAVSRNFSRVFMKLTSRSHIKFLSEEQIDKIVDISFSWIIDKNEKAAVVAFSIYTLSNLLHKRNWLATDLKLHIINNIDGSLPSFKSVGKKTLKTIELFNLRNEKGK